MCRYDYVNTLFIGDLSLFCTESNLKELFEKFGPVEAILLKRSNDNDHTSLSYGFVKFINKNDAAKALNEVNGIMFLGRQLR